MRMILRTNLDGPKFDQEIEIIFIYGVDLEHMYASRVLDLQLGYTFARYSRAVLT